MCGQELSRTTPRVGSKSIVACTATSFEGRVVPQGSLITPRYAKPLGSTARRAPSVGGLVWRSRRRKAATARRRLSSDSRRTAGLYESKTPAGTPTKDPRACSRLRREKTGSGNRRSSSARAAILPRGPQVRGSSPGPERVGLCTALGPAARTRRSCGRPVGRLPRHWAWPAAGC